MKLLHEIKKLLRQDNHMGCSSGEGFNLVLNDEYRISLTANDLLNKIEELGYEITKKDELEKMKSDEFWKGYKVSCEHTLQFSELDGVHLKQMLNHFLNRYKNGELEYNFLQSEKQNTIYEFENKGGK